MRASRRWLLVFACVGSVVLLWGCGSGSNETLAAFEQRWHRAAHARQAEALFDMLDTRSRRKIRMELETLRGLSPQAQRQVMAQLGGERVPSLLDVTTQRYFALLWNRITDGRWPQMRIEAAGGDSAYMLLSLNSRVLRVRLLVEAGRWSWALPEENFQDSFGPPTTQPDTLPASPGTHAPTEP